MIATYKVRQLKSGSGFYPSFPSAYGPEDNGPIFDTEALADTWGRLRRQLTILRAEGNRVAAYKVSCELENVSRLARD
jgi:hypothetical protein